MNPMRLRIRLLRRLRQWLPPELAEKVVLTTAEAGWSGSPLARLPLGTHERAGCLRLQLDRALAAGVRRQGVQGLPAAQGWSGWQPLGRHHLHFKAVRPQGQQVLLLDALHECVWLLWREPSRLRVNRKY
ncbi:MAG: hypothetical protein WA956_14245 [Stenotrophomonas sp.]